MATGGRQERSNSTREGAELPLTALLWRVRRGARLGPRQLPFPPPLTVSSSFLSDASFLIPLSPCPYYLLLVFPAQCLCRQTIRNAD